MKQHRKRESREDGLWRDWRDYGTMARARDSKLFWSNVSLSGHLAQQFTIATNKQVQVKCDKLGQRVIQTSVSFKRVIELQVTC